MRPALAVKLLCLTIGLTSTVAPASAQDRSLSDFEMAHLLQSDGVINGPFQRPIESAPPADQSLLPPDRKSNSSDFQLRVSPRPANMIAPPELPSTWTARPDDCAPLVPPHPDQSVIPPAPATSARPLPLEMSAIPSLPPRQFPAFTGPPATARRELANSHASHIIRASNSEVDTMFAPPSPLLSSVGTEEPGFPSSPAISGNQSPSFVDPDQFAQLSDIPSSPSGSSAPQQCNALCPRPEASGRLSPYLYLGSHVGDDRVYSGGGAFLPLWQDAESVLFADLSGQYDDHGSSDGSFGLGYREYLNPNWIFGAHAYYDVSETSQNNTFHSGSLGIELLSVDWEFRIDGYLPANHGRPSNSAAGISNGTIVSWNFQERAYRGFNWEVGHRFLHWGWNDKFEARWFVGSYHFDNSNSNFPSLAGPAGRLELRVHDLGWIGHQSRLDIGLEASSDRLHDEQIYGYARVQIPLGGGKSRPYLDPLRRHLLDATRHRVN